MRGCTFKRGKKWAFVVELPRDPETGKRRQKWVTVNGGEREAQRAMRQFIIDMENTAKEQKEQQTDITLGEFLGGEFAAAGEVDSKILLDNNGAVKINWIQQAKSRTTPSTYRGYETIVRCHLIPKLGHIRLRDLNTATIEAYYEMALKSGRVNGEGGLDPQSVRNHHNVLRAALERAVVYGLIEKNPAQLAQRPSLRSRTKAVSTTTKEKSGMRVLPPAELTYFLQQAKPERIYPATLIAAMTGMRRGEALALRWCDFDLDARMVSVTRNLQRSKDKGLVIDDPKTKCSIRQIDIPELLVCEMRRLVKLEKDHCRMLGVKFSEKSLIMHRDNGEPVYPDNVTAAFTKLLKKLGMEHMGFHGLRHTHATTLLKAGVPVKVVSERLGHSSVRVTMEIYQHVLPTMQKEAAARLDELYGSV